MGLKVLLADDSSAIKKVVQLCLQDFGVELKTVASGKEVIELVRQFKPDLALIDVMLPHKPGYDVAAELKKDPQFKALPIIMLWSSFMEFDEAKFKASGAEGRLEKPFEAGDLRAIVKKYVPKTLTNPFLDHIDFPKMEMPPVQAPTSIPAIPGVTTLSANQALPPVMPPRESGAILVEPPEPLEATLDTTSTEMEAWSMSSFIDIGKFSENITNTDATLPPMNEDTAPQGLPQDSEWVRKDLGKFKMDLKEKDLDENLIEPVIPKTPPPMPRAPGLKDPSASIMKGDVPKKEKTLVEIPTSGNSGSEEFSMGAADSELRRLTQEMIAKQISEIVEREARAIIEKAIWKIVPDMATQIIKEEIRRLTD